MIKNDSFIAFGNELEGLLFDDSAHPKYPIRYYNIVNGQGIPSLNGKEAKEGCSYYGYVYSGVCMVYKSGLPSVYLSEGMFFSGTDFDWFGKQGAEGSGLTGKMILIEVLHTKGVYPETSYKAMDMFGVTETTGRLNYIDGCTDSLLIAPVKLGDPCLNFLHYPEKIDQTPHTHPSHRIGIVANGSGLCKTPFGNVPLKKNMIFIIREWDGVKYGTGEDGNEYPAGTHSFMTFDEQMSVIAFHPDSDFGATDVNHPMINRTIVDGVPASLIPEIQTKKK